MSSGEPVATESILKQYGITIIEDVYSPAKTKHILDGEKIVEIPDSVQYVRETLLDIDVTIPNTFKSFFDEELQILRTNNGDTLEIQDVVPPWSAYISLLENPVSTKKIDIEAAEQSVERIAQVARKARRLVAESASQEKWNSFLKTHIFQSFGDSNSVNSKHSELFDSWYLY
ncbi:hypothetical protein BGW36DRAFT_128403 [Talaromyces proteolyticus]|uniref:Uncharacterized protein n=1 Tax=Talaromyces proteolyticus TaxID=1131652 RepID=A0AAD4PXT4_9EURO|nr:uncharacterized protein BGW36DRAFT_128403 [Talaromyces proteolyticus]KAH8700385.1 hypothetical protein BGW36DRAFT_128403 [Talaromyces proteolyticus]